MGQLGESHTQKLIEAGKASDTIISFVLADATVENMFRHEGQQLREEKLPGVHLAFGDPYGSQTHAAWTSRTHVDVLARACNVWIDEEQVISKGRYLLDRLGLA